MPTRVVAGAVLVAVLTGEVVVPGLVAQLAPDDLTILNGEDLVVPGPAEVLADRFAIVRDRSDSHRISCPLLKGNAFQTRTIHPQGRSIAVPLHSVNHRFGD